VNEKCQVTQKRLYSEEGKRRRTSGIISVVTGQHKSMEKQRPQRKVASSSKPNPWLPSQGRGN
jgi:hypothetical protein